VIDFTKKHSKVMARRKMSLDPVAIYYTEYGIDETTPLLSRMAIFHRLNRGALGLPDAPMHLIEKSVFLIYDSMEAATRTFHNIEHLLDLAPGADPLQMAAIAFHDVVYYQIDGGFTERQQEYLSDIVVEKDGVLSITTKKLEIDLEIVMAVFGYDYGQELNPVSGMNEFLSACVGSRLQNLLDENKSVPTLSYSVNLKRAACIEATIPFRGLDDQGRRPPEALFDRLVAANEKFDLGIGDDELVRAVQRAADLGNRDLENFSWTDRAAFMSNTWKLLPESNIALRNDTFYVSDMALAMKKMAGFFEHLDANTIFSSFRDSEAEVVVKAKTEQARKNIVTALKYMRCKLLSLSLLYAVAELSGGDAPLFLFTGDFPITPRRIKCKRIEDYLDIVELPGLQHDSDVWKLLHEGRELDTKFDPKRSPFAAFLYGHIGDDGLKKSIKYCVHPMDDKNAYLLLESIPTEVCMLFLDACSKIALIRSQMISLIAERIKERCDKKSLNSHDHRKKKSKLFEK
jgi:hypothetical protein